MELRGSEKKTVVYLFRSTGERMVSPSYRFPYVAGLKKKGTRYYWISGGTRQVLDKVLSGKTIINAQAPLVSGIRQNST